MRVYYLNEWIKNNFFYVNIDSYWFSSLFSLSFYKNVKTRFAKKKFIRLFCTLLYNIVIIYEIFNWLIFSAEKNLT